MFVYETFLGASNNIEDKFDVADIRHGLEEHVFREN